MYIEVDCDIPNPEDYSSIETLESLEDKWYYIENEINWESMLASLSDPDKHSPTSPFLEIDVAKNLCLQYKRYLYLVCKHDGSVHFSPSVGIDIFWHAHILDTIAYHRDCYALYGRYIHHFPYFGIRSDKDKENLESTFENTKRLYLEEFGEILE